jgi:hypothetical protein
MNELISFVSFNEIWNQDVPPKQYPAAANSVTPAFLRASSTLSSVGRVSSWVWFDNQSPTLKLFPGLRASAGRESPLW